MLKSVAHGWFEIINPITLNCKDPKSYYQLIIVSITKSKNFRIGILHFKKCKVLITLYISLQLPDQKQGLRLLEKLSGYGALNA